MGTDTEAEGHVILEYEDPWNEEHSTTHTPPWHGFRVGRCARLRKRFRASRVRS